jgi:hypothetical protein
MHIDHRGVGPIPCLVGLDLMLLLHHGSLPPHPPSLAMRGLSNWQKKELNFKKSKFVGRTRRILRIRAASRCLVPPPCPALSSALACPV